jgi:hypothetical protein
MSARLIGVGSSGSSGLSREVTVSDLAEISFTTYLVIVRLLLARFGYEFVSNLGRWHLRSYKPIGGADFIVAYPSVQGPVRVLVQVKQETRNLQRRYVDELRNAMDRAGVSHGLIITLGGASKPAREAADCQPGRPIRIIAGAEFARYLNSELGFAQSDLDNLRHLRFSSQPWSQATAQRSRIQSSKILSGGSAWSWKPGIRRAHSQIELAIAFIAGVIVGVLVR